ncbi:MAG: radical SAM/SPASM domain-containing protein [Desulfurellales bacterium]|nr:MAG: radical SAM/SPASM domain-containing protein [Desulfurellales bacterium]
MAKYRQDPPFCIQVELSEGCNLRCSFCGINGIRTAERTYKFMTQKTAHAIASQIAALGWNCRIEFAMHGEPTVNPEAAEIVGVFRTHLPKASLLMLSNGGGLVDDPKNKIEALFAHGLNTLGLDEYQNVKLVPKILEKLRAAPHSPSRVGFDFYVYPDQPDGNPHKRQAPKARRLVHIRPIDVQSKGTHATLNNHAGSGAPLNTRAAGKPCAKPFRELSFRWDGATSVCCNDWRGVLPAGNIHKEGLEGIWYGPIMEAARRKLVLGQRDFGPCNGCDALSYRTGLLPDKKGAVTLPKPSKADNELLSAKYKPLTKPVKREWEK